MNLPWKKKTDIDVVIDDVTTRMRVVGPDDPEYKKLVKYLDHLTKMRDAQRNRRRVSPDTVAIVLGNLAIAVIVVLAERDNVISTKARDFLTRSKT